MQVEVQDSGEKVRLQLSGMFNEKGAELFKSRLAALDLQRVREVEIDAARVSHFGSSSIGKLLVFYKHFVAAGGRLRVVNLPLPIYEMFLELKLDSLFPVSKS